MIIKRLRNTNIGELLSLIRLRRIDLFVYETCENMKIIPHKLKCEVRLEKFDSEKKPGIKNIDNRLSGGKFCYIFYAEDKYAHESWLMYDVLLPAQFGLNTGFPVIGDCLTADQFKGKSIYPYVIGKIAEEIKVKNGGAYISVDSDNIASIRGIEKAGFRKTGRVKGLKILGVFLYKKLIPSK